MDAALFNACMGNDEHHARRLLEARANPDATQVIQQGVTITPLALAAGRGSIGLARLLLSHNASVNQAVLGSTPLYVACQSGNAGVAALLLQRKADVDATLQS